MPTFDDEVTRKYIAGCRKHNQESQYALFRHFHSYALGIARRYARNSDEASDILSESFLKVFSHIDRFDSSKPFKSWLGKIVTNTAIDYYRSSLKFAQQDDVMDHEHIGVEASVYEKLAYDELLAMIRSLSPAYQAVFNLYAVDGYTHNEIAVMLGITVNTSKSNLHKARKKLQELLENKTGKMTNGFEENEE